jgi:hypothetical protein
MGHARGDDVSRLRYLDPAAAGQTWATDELLNILGACVPPWTNGQTLASLGPANPAYWHLVVEAKKLAFEDLYTTAIRTS